MDALLWAGSSFDPSIHRCVWTVFSFRWCFYLFLCALSRFVAFHMPFTTFRENFSRFTHIYNWIRFFYLFALGRFGYGLHLIERNGSLSHWRGAREWSPFDFFCLALIEVALFGSLWTRFEGKYFGANAPLHNQPYIIKTSHINYPHQQQQQIAFGIPKPNKRNEYDTQTK